MSKDIRSFFSVISKKPGDQSKPVKKSKKTVVVIDSDDEDVIRSTPESKNLKKENKRKAHIISSDSEDEGQPLKKERSPKKKEKKKEDTPKLKPVNIDDVFKNVPIKQSKVEPVVQVNRSPVEQKKNKKKNKKNTELGIHGDKDFEKTLQELDEDSDDTILLDNLDFLDKTIEEAELKDKLKLNAEKDNVVKEKQSEKAIERKETPKKAVTKRQRRDSGSNVTPNKKLKLEHTDSGIDPDQEKWEKKRYSAALYQKYLHRGGPKHHGGKQLPKGKADCLKNLTFLKTGVLDSLESEEFEGLVTDHGGRVVHSVSKKVNYIVLGDDPGPAKLEKAKHLGIPEISEDQFLDMILVKSGMKPKYSENNESEDFGLGSSENGSPKSDKSEKIVKNGDRRVTNLNKSREKTPCKEINGDKKSKEKWERTRSPSVQKERKISEPTTGKPTDTLQIRKEEKTSQKTTSPSPKNEPKQEKLPEKPTSFQSIKNEEKTSQKTKSPSPKKEYKQEKLSQEPTILLPIKKEETLSEASDKSGLTFTDARTFSWTEKYKPANIRSIVGQQEKDSNMNKLRQWLQDWFANQDPEKRANMIRPNPWREGAGGWYKAALLSGPPGVGKTTTATLVAKELGFDIVEFNASDTRNKKLLHEEISQMMKIKSVAGFASGENNMNKKRVLLMDEVDGMAGNEDRGGIAELTNFIKSSNFPIICMCNDRYHQKMKTLATYCYGLRFGKPSMKQIRGAMLSICFKEGLNIKPEALAQLIIGTGCDIRQTLNHLALWSATEKNLSMETVEKESKNSQKDVVIGVWDVIKKIFNKRDNENMSIQDKARLFFYDYSMGPLFVQENYLSVIPDCKGSSKNYDAESIIRASLTADSLSTSDIIDSKIRSTNNWSLLECQSFFVSVLPSAYMSGHLKETRFPQWFGNNSGRNKNLRFIGELYSHARTSISGDKFSIRSDYARPLRDKILQPLLDEGKDGISKTLSVMKSYCLLRDDLTNLCDLLCCFQNQNPFTKIESKVKSALTRLYNKEMVLPFAPPTASKKKKTDRIGEEGLLGEEEEEAISDDDREDDGLEGDAMIKIKHKESVKAGTSKNEDHKKDQKNKGKTSSSAKKSKASKGKGKK